MPKKALFFTLLVVLLGIAPKYPAHAQTSYEFDITSFPYSASPPAYIDDYTVPVGAWTLVGDDYESNITQANWLSGLEVALIDYELASDVYPQSISVAIYSNSNNGTCNANIARYVLIYFMQGDTVMYPDPFGRTAIVALGGSANTTQTVTVDFATVNIYSTSTKLNTLSPDTIGVTIGTLCNGTFASRTITQRVGSVSFDYTYSPTIAYVSPLLDDDQISITTDGATIATANRPFLPVHAPANGTVTSITPYESQDCLDLGVGVIQCTSSIATSGTYTVVLDIGGTSATYIVADAPTYLTENENVYEGCIMGESTQNGGLVITTIDEDDFTVEPDEDAVPCKDAEPPEPQCVNDSLANETDWYKQGAVTWGDEVILGAGARIYQIVALPTNARTRMTVTAKNSAIEIRIGNTVRTFSLIEDYTDSSVPYGNHTANLVDFFEISIKNTGATDVTISDVCLEIEQPQFDVTGPQTSCYFENYLFSDGLDKWSTTGSVTDGTGMALLARGAGIAQNVVMLDKEYVLELEIGLWINDGFDLEANASTPISVSYVFPLGEPPVYVDFPTFTIGDIGDSEDYIISVSITPDSEALEGDFYIEIDAPTLSGLRGVSITRACLRPADGDWGDNPPPDDGLPFTEYCETISPPRGNDISRWITWHWHNLSQFFECDLMVTLNNTYGLLRWFQAMAMLFFNWLGDMGTWINGHVQNLIFAIANAQQLRTYQMPDEVTPLNFLGGGIGSGFSTPSSVGGGGISTPMSGESCQWYDVFCHGRNIVGGVVDFAGGVVEDGLSAVINFFGSLLGTIVDSITYGLRTFFDAISTVWNNIQALVSALAESVEFITNGANGLLQVWNEASPIAPPGLQDCQVDPETKMNCWFFWTLEHTIFSGTYGTLIIPLLTSVLSISGLLMLIGKFLEIIRTAKDA